MIERDPAARAAMLKALRWYILLTFIPVMLLAAIAARAGGLAAFPAALLAMLVPALAAFVVQKLVVKAPIFRGGALGFRLGRKRWWLLAPAAIGLLVALAYAITFALDPQVLASRSQIAATAAELRLPESFRTPGWAMLLLLSAVLVGTFVNLPVYLGEEIGWRGFMTPSFTALYGRAGILLVGLVWGLWHTPLILLGHNYPDNPGIGLLIWIPFCIAVSVLLQAAYGVSRSIFVPALAHGMLNQIAGTGAMMLVVAPAYIDWLHGPAGLIGLAVMSVPALWIWTQRPELLLGPAEALGPSERSTIG